MLFDIKFLPSEEERKEALLKYWGPTRQSVVYLSDGQMMPYTFEDLLNHHALYLREMRVSNPTQTWQRACDQFERFGSQEPRKEQVLVQLLAAAIAPKYPSVKTSGFNLGVLLLPNEGSNELSDGGTLVLGLFPRAGEDYNDGLGWPVGWAPCVLSFPISDTDPAAFWGLIGSGMSDRLPLLPLNEQGETAQARRMEVQKAVLRDLPKTPLFVGQGQKHCFLNHALNHLVHIVNMQSTGQSGPSLQVGDEVRVSRGEGESTTLTPRPFVRAV